MVNGLYLYSAFLVFVEHSQYFYTYTFTLLDERDPNRFVSTDSIPYFFCHTHNGTGYNLSHSPGVSLFSLRVDVCFRWASDPGSRWGWWLGTALSGTRTPPARYRAPLLAPLFPLPAGSAIWSSVTTICCVKCLFSQVQLNYKWWRWK